MHGVRPTRPLPLAVARALAAAVLLCGLLAGGAAPTLAQPTHQNQPQPPPRVAAPPAALEPGVAELAFIERLYREGDAYRADSEAQRFLHQRPDHPQRATVELARAKLHYREGRYDETSLMLYSLLDRHPRGPAADDARTLLTFTHLRRGDVPRATQTAAQAGSQAGVTPAALAPLAEPPPGAVDAEAAAQWSTWLPGSGYVLLDAPGKAAVGVSLNLALVGATVAAVQAGNPPAAALFLVLEAMLWQGGRQGVRQEAEAANRRLRARRIDEWLATHGEPEVLGSGLALRFGG